MTKKQDIPRRAIKATAVIESGDEIIDRAFFVADKLWNYTWWCAVGFCRSLQRSRGDWGSLKGKLPPYPGFFSMSKELRDYWAFQELSDKVASGVVKEFDANMRSFFSNIRSNPNARPPRPSHNGRALNFEFGRNAKHLGDWRFRLSVLGGKNEDRYSFVTIQARQGISPKQIRVIRIMPGGSDGRRPAILIVTADPAPVSAGDGYAALDLGIANLGVVAFGSGESILYPGGVLLDVQRYYAKKVAACKPSNYKKGVDSKKRSSRSKAYSDKWNNKKNLIVHNFTTHVIQQCVSRKIGTLLVGDLRGIRNGKDFGDKTNQKLHAWPFRKIIDQLTYKGRDSGVQIIETSEAYTSQTCAACGVVNKNSRVKRGLYSCRTCGIVMNADLNGAINILKKVSPGKELGVVGDFPADRSTGGDSQQGFREVDMVSFANHPDFVAKFDLLDFSISTVPTYTGKSHRLQWASPVRGD